MAINCYLAMTAAEISANKPLPPNLGWMACHFSPYCTGLSNLPRALPPDALLILDDITPIHGHDPARIADQLRERIEALKCGSVLLDFQRPGSEEAAALAEHLVQALPCPVGVSAAYAGGLDCPVFLPPVPTDVAPADWLGPWKGREVWLEAALEGQTLTLTPEGCRARPLPCWDAPACPFPDERLHCHYGIRALEDRAEFCLTRTMEDLNCLLEAVESLGVTRAIGLWQELGG